MVESPGSPPVADHWERLRALDSTRSFIVQAPAGSGKTELLIQRFLTLLGTAEEPESVVAITFTRKAATEMRHRVIRALEDAARADPSDLVSPHQRRTRELAARVLARDAARGWELGHHPSRLAIQTIDSLSASLVRRMPWISRMGAPPEPEENPEYLYRKAAHATLRLLDAPDGAPSRVDALTRLLEHLDNNVGRLAALLVDMLGRRDQWLRHVTGNPSPKSFERVLESALAGVVGSELASLARRFPLDAVHLTAELARFAARNLRDEGIASPLVDCLSLVELPSSEPDGLPQWRGLAEMFLKENGERRTRLTRLQGFPPDPEGRRRKAQCLGIALDADLCSRLQAIRMLPPESLDTARWDVLGALMEVLTVAVAQLAVVFQEEGRVDFTEITRACRDALGSPDAPTALAFAMDCRVRHLLVDEFQDTSRSQFDLLLALMADWAPDDGRTLFLVGDPMQSIYRFREAEVGLFLRARREGVGEVALTPLRLSVNFRSDPAIVRWVNTVLGPAFPKEEDVLTGAVTYTPSVGFVPPGMPGAMSALPAETAPGVTLHPLFDRDGSSEAGRVLDIIRQTRARGSGTIAVLVRSRSHLIRIVEALRDAGERFRALEIDPLGRRPVVQDLLALTRALLHPGDRVSWLAVLRAPWCGLRLADMHALLARDGAADQEAAIWDLLRDPARRTALSDDGRRRAQRLATILGDGVGRRGSMPVRRWVEGVWVALGGPAGLDSRTDLKDAEVYLDLLEGAAPGADLLDERKFQDDVARLYSRSDVDADETLQLLTIHKAKGLEFDTVILPGLGRWPPPENPALLRWLEYTDPEGNVRLLMAPIRETGGREDPLYGYLRRVGQIQDDHESTRLLYVAATRARRSLHLLGHVDPGATGWSALRSPAARSLLRKIWHGVEEDYRTASLERSEVVASRAARAPGVALRRLGPDWEPPPTPEGVPWMRVGATGALDPQAGEQNALRHPTFEWAGELQRRVGIVVHAMLERTRIDASGRKRPPAWDRETIRAALRTEGLDGERLAEAIRRVEGALDGVLADERGRWILSAHDEDRREHELCMVSGHRVRRYVLDRTFVEDGVRWIIDYKIGIHQGGGVDAFLDNEQARYRRQLESYAEAFVRIDPRPIRLGLYFPVLRGWREWRFRRLEPDPEVRKPMLAN